MEKSIIEIIRGRRSVRTFDGNGLDEADKTKLREFFSLSDNPFGIPIEFRFLDADTYKLTSPVIVGAKHYVAAKVKRIAQWEIAFGYSFEKFCLYAEEIGIGTVMMAGTLGRKAFEAVVDLADDEIMPLASPVGYVAQKMSVREKLMRKGVKADKRLPFEELFYDGSFGNGLATESAGKFADALEMVRLAPSAVNKQPWRIVVDGDCVRFYEKKSLGTHNGVDIQKVDIGIAIAHFDLTMKEAGYSGSFVVEDDKQIDGVEYVVTYKLD